MDKGSGEDAGGLKRSEDVAAVVAVVVEPFVVADVLLDHETRIN